MRIIRLASSGSLEMKSLNLLSVVEAAGKPALLIVFTIAVIGMAAFDRDPEVEGDGPALAKVDWKKSFLFGVGSSWFWSASFTRFALTDR